MVAGLGVGGALILALLGAPVATRPPNSIRPTAKPKPTGSPTCRATYAGISSTAVAGRSRQADSARAGAWPARARRLRLRPRRDPTRPNSAGCRRSRRRVWLGCFLRDRRAHPNTWRWHGAAPTAMPAVYAAPAPKSVRARCRDRTATRAGRGRTPARLRQCARRPAHSIARPPAGSAEPFVIQPAP